MVGWIQGLVLFLGTFLYVNLSKLTVLKYDQLKGAIFLDFDQICIQHMQQANKNSLECRQIEFAWVTFPRQTYIRIRYAA